MSELDGPATDFRALFESAPCAFLALAPDSPCFTILAVSDAFLRETHTRRSDIVGQGLFDVFPDNPNAPEVSGRRELRSSLERVIHSRAPDAMPVLRYDLPQEEGGFEERYWSLLNTPVLDARGEVASIIHRLEDVTRAQLMERNATAILERITDAFLAFDREWRFTYVNRRAEEILARGRQELLGRVLWEEFPTAWHSPFGREYRQAMREQTSREFEAHSSTVDRWFQVHAHPSEVGLSVYFHDVTERLRMAEALRASELRYRTLFDNSMDGILLTTPDGRIHMVNRACTEMLGYTEQELRVLGRQAVVDPSDPQLQAALEERRRSGRFRGELTMKRRDGMRIPVEASSAIFQDEHGLEWTSLFLRDISRRKAVEAERERLLGELETERRWYKDVLDHLPLGVILFEPGGTLYVNRRSEELLGMKVTPGGGSAQYASRVLYPDGTPVPPEQLVSSRVLRTGETVLGAEFLLERPDGSRLPILGSAAPIRNGEGRMLGAVGMFQDVSERMQAAEAIRANERLLSGIFELLPVGLWLTDSTGRTVRTNPAASRIWGDALWGEPARKGYKGWWVDTGRPVEDGEWPLNRALERGEATLGALIRIQRPDGTQKTLVNSALPLHDEQGRFSGALVVHEDVTKLKDVEEALVLAVRSRDDVLGVVAHDLRNPLNGILLQLQLVYRMGQQLEPRVQRALEAVQRNAMRMNRLIQDLLDVARMEAGRLSVQRARVDTRTLLADVLETQQALASVEAVELQLDVRGAPPAVWGDRERLVQVLENLIGNAVKFTGRGGLIRVGASARGQDVLFWVADTGPGIPAEQLPRLFDRFWQASRKDKRGAGLGLAIVKGLVDSHGGHVWAESRVGAGTTFFFTIPAAPALDATLSDAR